MLTLAGNVPRRGKARVPVVVAQVAGCAAGAALAALAASRGASLLAGVALFAVLVAATGPRAIAGHRRRRRRQELESDLATALELFARSLAAGRSLFNAVGDATSRIHGPLHPVLDTARTRMGRGERAGDALASSLTDADAGEAVETVARLFVLHDGVGGRLAGVLRRMAALLRERRALEGEVASLTAQGRLSAAVVASLPVAAQVVLPPASLALIPLTARLVMEISGWVLAFAGLGLVWHMTRSDVILGLRKGRVTYVIRAPGRVLVTVGRAVPAALGGSVRTRRLLKAISVPATPDRCREITGQRVVCSLTAAAFCATIFGKGAALLVPAAFLLGLYLPEVLWKRWHARRVAMLERGVPEWCEVMALGLGGGANLHMAIRHAAALVPPPLGRRLQNSVGRITAGEPLEQALVRELGETGSRDVDDVLASILEAHRLGGRLAEVIEDVAADMRLRSRFRFQRAARQVPVRILVPLVFCILPAFVILTIVPLLATAMASLSR